MPHRLADLYRAQLDNPLRTPAERVDRPPRGWLLASGICGVAEPFVVRMPQWEGDLARFGGLDGPAARAVLERLPPEARDERQNDAPSLVRILSAAAEHPGVVEVHGYLVGPDREDERISADSFTVHAWPDLRVRADHDDGCECDLLLDRVQDELGIDDALSPPHEIRSDHARQAGRAAPGWCLWWD